MNCHDLFPISLDIAVGSPYEDDGRGAVYIYLGNEFGLNSKYSQKISALDVSETLKGFGHALTRAVDVDSNRYPGRCYIIRLWSKTLVTGICYGG